MKIKKIQVHAQGPLRKNLQIEAKNFNLIYGRNETGKTFLLETIASWLFGKGRNAPLKKVSRKWTPTPSGFIEVVGLDKENESIGIVLDPSSESNLQDHFVNDMEMPPNLSELLMVRAGETLLENPDELVKANLSASGMLQDIINEKQVSRTIQRATIEEGVIRGNNTGEIKSRNQWQERLISLRKLRGRYAEEKGGELDGLEEEISTSEKELQGLMSAKQFLAHKTFLESQSLKEKIEKEPHDLDDLEDQVDELEKVRSEFSDKNKRIMSLEDDLKHKNWADHAYARFRELEASQREQSDLISESNPFFMLMFAVSLIGASALFFASIMWAGLVGLVLALLFLVLWFAIKKRHKQSSRKQNPEIDKIKTEFKEKFGDELVSEAFFQSKVERLILFQGQKEESQRDLSVLRNKEIELYTRLETRLGKCQEGTELVTWKAQLSASKNKREELEKAAQEKRSQVDRLGITREEYLLADPGIVWDEARFKEVKEELDSLNQRRHQSQIEQGELKTEIAAKTDCSSGDWEELISVLEQKIEEAEIKYREITAEIIGKIAVVSTVQKLQEKEDELIAQNLSSPEYNIDIQEISGGRVQGFSWEDGELRVMSEGMEAHSREILSTGAKEQLMIALRTLFSRIYLQQKPCFLLLDDAFQHSDWERRELLADYIIRLVSEKKWQVFYFTMDDHLRDLFRKRAEEVLSQEFLFHEL